MVKLPPEIVHELELAGDSPLRVENPRSKRVYLLVDTERYELIRRRPAELSEQWTDEDNDRRCALIRKKYTQGITDDCR